MAHPQEGPVLQDEISHYQQKNDTIMLPLISKAKHILTAHLAHVLAPLVVKSVDHMMLKDQTIFLDKLF